jgi:hypothetical protein
MMHLAKFNFYGYFKEMELLKIFSLAVKRSLFEIKELALNKINE